MTNNQFDPNQESEQLSEEELEAVAGGGIIGDIYNAGKEFVGDVYEAGKDLVSDMKDVLDKS